jgi:hypothetical protein
MERRQLFARVLRERSTGLGLMLAISPKQQHQTQKNDYLAPECRRHTRGGALNNTILLHGKPAGCVLAIYMCRTLEKQAGRFISIVIKWCAHGEQQKKTRLFCVRSPLSTLRGKRLVYLKHACRHEVSLVCNGFFGL